MAKNIVSEISNAFSTGGGGVNFEQRIQAMFLLSLLVDGFCPIMNGQTEKIYFQAKHKGFDIDDFVVITSNGKLLCQVKHNIIISDNDKTFNDFICAAWSDFNKDFFDKENDRIALATAQISKNSQKSFSSLHMIAIDSIDERDFYEKVNLQPFTSKNSKKTLNILESCIEKIEGKKPSQMEMWKFCQSITLLIFDLDCIESINYALSTSLIRCKSLVDARLVWSRLVEYAGLCNQNAASINKNSIDSSIRDLFSLKSYEYVQPEPITEIDMFIPALALIGAWRENNQYDQQTIEMISGLKYSEFEAKAKNMLVQNSDYLRLANGIWSVLHKEELLDQCKEIIFDNTLEKAIKATQDVLSKTSKVIASQTRYFYSSIDEFDNSIEVRNELTKSLCWIKKNILEISNCNRENTETALYQMVKTILNDADWIKWASLRTSLQYISELSPDAFLDSLEREIINKPQEIIALFPHKDSEWLGQTNYITEVLWSLEVLAWSPDYIVRSIRVLGLLETLPYERTNWNNTPINSIISIILPWYPQTLADFDKRKNALCCLEKDNSAVYWNVLYRLLPNHTTSTIRTPKPQYLSLNIPEEIKVTQSDVVKEYGYYLELAVEIGCNEAEKLAELSDQIGFMNEKTLIRYLDCIEGSLETNTDEQSFKLWINLREFFARIKSAEKPIINKQMDRIHLIIQDLEPKDIKWKYKELYLGRKHLFDKEDYTNAWSTIENEKKAAIYDIFKQLGVIETETFGRSVNSLHDVAYKLGSSLSMQEVSQIIDSCYKGEVSKEFTVICVESYVNNNGPESIMDTSLNQTDDDFILDILSKIHFSVGILGVVNKLISDKNRYWENVVMPYNFIGKDVEQLNEIVNKLVACKRYVTAINIVGRSEFHSHIDIHTILNLLTLAGTENSIEKETIDDFAVLRIIGWFQNQDSISLESRSDIEFIYLPILDSNSAVKPHALYTRLSNNPEYFCSLFELFLKKEFDDENEEIVNQGLSERLFKIMFKFNVTPGIDWNGCFVEAKFYSWMRYVNDWSKENNKYSITMHTVGSGLSYSQLDAEKLPAIPILEVLNKAENEELRRGYFLGIVNQRGVHIVDPEGKPEFELAEDYSNRANVAEAKGYSRYADVLREVADQYIREAERIINSSHNYLE